MDEKATVPSSRSVNRSDEFGGNDFVSLKWGGGGVFTFLHALVMATRPPEDGAG